MLLPEKVPDAYLEREHIPVESFIRVRMALASLNRFLPVQMLEHLVYFHQSFEHGLVQPYTVTATLLQLAHLMGCSPIYLIGCDTYYHPQQENTKEVRTSRIAGTKIFQADCNNDPNHFDPAYFGKGKSTRTLMLIRWSPITKL